MAAFRASHHGMRTAGRYQMLPFQDWKEGRKGSWTIAVTAQIEAETAGKGAVSTEPSRNGKQPPNPLVFLTYLHPNEGSVRP